MRNKLFAIALGGLLAFGASAALYAQDQAPPSGQQEGHRRGMDADRQLEHLTKTLNLSSDQQSQIKPLLVDRQQKMQALWQDQSLSPQDRRSKMMAIRQDTDTKLEAALNDQQKQQFEAMQAKMQEHRRQGGDNQAPNGTVQPQ
jgi:hypothetical protein